MLSGVPVRRFVTYLVASLFACAAADCGSTVATSTGPSPSKCAVTLAPPASPITSDGASTTVGVLFGIARGAAFAGIALLIGGVTFAVAAGGRVLVDDGAKRALVSQGRSLLAAGVRDVEGEFDPDDAVEVVGEDGRAFAKGLVRYSAKGLRAAMGRRSGDLPDGAPAEVIHRDDLVVLTE